MIIALPTLNGEMCEHFGHCSHFAFIQVDTEKSQLSYARFESPPKHKPGSLPRWLNEKKVNVVIAGGMGQRAINMFNEFDIQVVTGIASGKPGDIVAAFLEKKLESVKNLCDHDSHSHDGNHCGQHH